MSLNPYLETSIRTADPVQLVVQLFDGALRFVAQAREHEDAGRTRERGEAISRALAIVHELRGSLDLEQGAEVAKSLDSLYAFASDQLLAANRTRRMECLDAVVRVLTPLRDAFATIASGEAPSESEEDAA